MAIRGAFWWANFGFVAVLIYLGIAWYLELPRAGQGILFLAEIFGFAVFMHASAGAMIGVNVMVFGDKPIWMGFWGAIFGAGCGLASARRIVSETVPWNDEFFIYVGTIGMMLGALHGIGVLAGEVNR